MAAESDGFRFWQGSRRVAVLGMSSSGKTVFLTSLIDRILRRDGMRSTSILGDVTLRVDRPPPVDGIPAFPYEYYREDCLRTQRWPDKTLASSQFRLRRTQSGDRILGPIFRQVSEERTLIDIPGERIADFSMAGRTYEEWSDQTLATLEENRYLPFTATYLSLDEQGPENLDLSTILIEYKRVLARFAQRLIPLVSPSVFLVDERGNYPTRTEPPVFDQSLEDLVERRLTGLDRDSEFAPLSARLREKYPAIADRFARNFSTYRKRLADPLGAGFSSCDQLIVLVDVAAILEEGPEVYHATRKTLQLALEYLDPGSDAGGRLRDLALRLITGGRWGSRGIRDVAVIATKADCVHQLDRANLVPLLRQMTRDILEPAIEHRGLNVRFFECAAVEATQSSKEYPWMTGYASLSLDSPDFPERLRFKVSDVPGEWLPESVWRETRFTFADTEPPKLDLLGREPFPGINMDKVTEFIGWPDSGE